MRFWELRQFLVMVKCNKRKLNKSPVYSNFAAFPNRGKVAHKVSRNRLKVPSTHEHFKSQNKRQILAPNSEGFITFDNETKFRTC